MHLKIFFGVFLSVFCLLTYQAEYSTHETDLQNNGDQFPRKLWAYWDTGYHNLPTLTKLCIQRMKKLLEPKGWTVTLLEDSTLHLYIDYDDYRDVVFRSTSQLVAHKADLLRLYVLQKNGGLWVDGTTVLLDDLQWLNSLQNEKGVLNDYGEKAEVFLFYTDLYQSSTFYTDEKGNLFNDNPGYENWFIAVSKNNRLVREWKAKFIEYYTGTFCSIMEDWVENDQFSRSLHTRYYMEHNALNYVLQKKQRELDNWMSLFGDRITANRHYKILSMDSRVGPLTLRLKFLSEPASIYRYTMMEEQDVERQIGETKYFLKLINIEHSWMKCYFNKSMPLSETQNFVFGINKDVDFTIYPCFRTMFLMKNSIIWKYLIHDLDYQGELNIEILTKLQVEEKCNSTQVQNAIAKYRKPIQTSEKARTDSKQNYIYLRYLLIAAVYIGFNCLTPQF